MHNKIISIFLVLVLLLSIGTVVDARTEENQSVSNISEVVEIENFNLNKRNLLQNNGLTQSSLNLVERPLDGQVKLYINTYGTYLNDAHTIIIDHKETNKEKIDFSIILIRDEEGDWIYKDTGEKVKMDGIILEVDTPVKDGLRQEFKYGYRCRVDIKFNNPVIQLTENWPVHEEIINVKNFEVIRSNDQYIVRGEAPRGKTVGLYFMNKSGRTVFSKWIYEVPENRRFEFTVPGTQLWVAKVLSSVNVYDKPIDISTVPKRTSGEGIAGMGPYFVPPKPTIVPVDAGKTEFTIKLPTEYLFTKDKVIAEVNGEEVLNQNMGSGWQDEIQVTCPQALKHGDIITAWIRNESLLKGEIAEYRVKANVYIDDTPETDDDRLPGYISVTFNPGNHGTLMGPVKFYVDPSKTSDLSDVRPPEIRADYPYRPAEQAWSPDYLSTNEVVVGEDQVYTAQYELITGEIANNYPLEPLNPRIKVANPSQLSTTEKGTVREAIKAELPKNIEVADEDILVGEDGSVTVSYSDGSSNSLTAEETIVAMTDKELYPLQPLEPKVRVKLSHNLDLQEKSDIRTRVKAQFPSEWNLTDANVQVANNGRVTFIYPSGEKASLEPSEVVVRIPQAELYPLKPLDPKIGVEDPNDIGNEKKRNIRNKIFNMMLNMSEDIIKSVDQIEVEDNGRVTVTYCDQSIYILESKDTVYLKKDSQIYSPGFKSCSIKLGESVKAKDCVQYFGSEPPADQTSYCFKDGSQDFTPDTVGKHQPIVYINYPDGSKSNITAWIDVSGQSDKYEPKGQQITVIGLGKSYQAEDGISNKDELPADTKYDIDNVDTSTEGIKNARVKVIYSDGSIDRLNVTVKVISYASYYEPMVETISVAYGESVDASAGISNKDTLPKHTSYRFKEAVDTTEVGSRNVIIELNYPDDSCKQVSTMLTVADTEDQYKYPIKAIEPRVEVIDPNNLTEEEKAIVRNKIKDQLEETIDILDENIMVDDCGSVKVIYPDESVNTLPSEVIVIKKDESKIYKLEIPTEKLAVNHINKLSNEEKALVEKNIKKVNTDLPANTTIAIQDNGEARIIYSDGSESTIAAEKLVREKMDAELYPLKALNPKVEVLDRTNLTAKEKMTIRKAIKEQLSGLYILDKDIVVDIDGSVTVVYPDNSQNSLTSSETIVEIEMDDPESVDKSQLAEAIEDGKLEQGKETYNNANDKNKQRLQDAISNGMKVYDDKEADQFEIDQAEEAIRNAISHLADEIIEDEVNKNGLESSIDKGKTLKDTDRYNKSNLNTKKIFDEALNYAMKIYGKVDASQEEVNYAKTILDHAIRQLNIDKKPIKPISKSEKDDLEDEEVNIVKPIRSADGLHKSYIEGYPDGTIRLNGSITRAEATTTVARLLNLPLDDDSTPIYSDIKSDWYNVYINAATKAGIIKGYPDGSFKANSFITRAEFAALIANFDKENSISSAFKDVDNHWAWRAINQCVANDRIKGYPDQTFKPDRNITRAEAITMINRTFERSVNKEGMNKAENIEVLNQFSDLSADHWAYYEVIEATNTHSYVRISEHNSLEEWIELRE